MRARTYTGLPAQARIATSSVVHRIVAVARAWLPKEAIDPALQSYHDYLKITRRTPLGDLFDVRGATALRSCGVMYCEAPGGFDAMWRATKFDV